MGAKNVYSPRKGGTMMLMGKTQEQKYPPEEGKKGEGRAPAVPLP